MTCPITVRLGVYALGVADAAERELVECHLAVCQECRAELVGLEPLPRLLARVPASLVQAGPAPGRLRGHARVARVTRAGGTQAGKGRAAARHWRHAAGVAVAALAGAAAGFWLAAPAATRPMATAPAAVTLSGANPVTHVRVRVTLTGTSWGTSIRVLAWGLPLNQPCRLVVLSRSGATEVAGTWDAWSSGPVSIPASAGWRLADISSLQVAVPGKTLVTVTATPASRHPRARPD